MMDSMQESGNEPGKYALRRWGQDQGVILSAAQQPSAHAAL